MFDVEAEMEAGAEAESPSDEELLDANIAEPRLAPVDPLSGIDAAAPDVEEPDVEDEEDDFFSEQRLSDELNQALEAPITEEEPLPPPPAEPAAPPPRTEDPLPASFNEAEEGTAIFDVEDEYEDEPESAVHEAVEPESGEHEPAPPAPPVPESSEQETAGPEPESDEANPYDPETGSHDDVLEDTPQFLEDAPEDENLWFEQRPPKDFDFDD
jgi:hypothetical protein